ncbi:ATP-dependent DNA ligase [Schumannella luteola]|uniref:DNA ligase (ATP) n=1 Tax=Schumannella luteola TaxID=472059 RepID=A0A852YEM9_9MICO|nr:ATP-dependent DNA ligase [Schumannella luteola]NYG99760.1 bifunctional non-homologous end joining protein LigD [Schumannella luteola]TPX06537.1 ATP-dependent DNA ligase [Schumannella luteola]
MAEKGTQVDVDGRRLTLTNLDKVMYPATGTTKGDVIDYYAAVASRLVPLAAGRAATRKRWVHGVGTAQDPGAMFFQKDLGAGTPSWVRTRVIAHADHDNVYPLVDDRATLVWLAQLATLELHVPQWRFGPRGGRHDPDRLVLDLDPGEGAGLPECVEVAKLARAILRDVGLDPIPVTSGSKGIHLYAGLDESRSSEQMSAFAHELARALEADHPELVVSEMRKAKRTGKVLVDWSQNNGSKTTIVPWSLRGRPRPTVAVPRTWRELGMASLAQLELPQARERIARRADPMAQLEAGHVERRLGEYRAKRRAGGTPEPFGDEAHRARRGEDDAPIFVVQEHHATRLHWDFRLEHRGVLVSWAVPKGVPDDSGQNRLAVQTEDHPLDYAGFAGEIPKGEYGAGSVQIWDHGRYELEKWREGEEVIVDLRGERLSGRYALIHTDADQWLLHRMKEQGDAESASGQAASVTTAASHPPARRPGRASSATPRDTTLAPMLATAGAPADIRDRDPAKWRYEMKWDGVRALARIADDRVELRSRNGLDLTATFPELQELAAGVPGSAVLDGEIVALDSAGRPSFARLQQRLGLTKERDVEKARRRVAVSVFLFDVLEIDGKATVERTWQERRAALEALVTTSSERIQVPPLAGDDLEHALEVSRRLGLEGVMAKRIDGRYRSGRRSADWLKLKHLRTQEVVIGGWRPGNGRRADSIGSLLLGVPDGGRLRYVGRVGTGFRERDLERMRHRLDALARVTSPLDDVPEADAADAHWVTPSLVAEVEYAGLTGEARLRQASWRGLRPDKGAAEVHDETGDPAVD